MIGRRKFLKGATMSLLPIVLNGFPIRAFSRAPLLNTIGRQFLTTGRSLVIIQLQGGNDGLNMVIPHAMSQYYTNRPNIAIPESQVLPLDSVMGLHPSLQTLVPLFQDGKLCVLQGVGYANPNRSHFRATDIWWSATDSSVILNTGWLGRDLGIEYPNYPGELTPNPLALQIGGASVLGLGSSRGGMGVTISDPNQFYQLIAGTVGFEDDPPPNTPAGAELRFLRTVEQEAIQYATVIKNASDHTQNHATYPNSSLAHQLAIIARLVAGGLDCPIYVVSQGSYDTHSSELSRQAQLLTDLGGAIAAFQSDLELLGVSDRVIGMTFSEFGRRIHENGSAGTDHGTSSPQFLFGASVIGGLYGPYPDFNNLDTTGDFIYTTDFRQLYSTILGQWFGAPETEVQTVLLRHFDRINVLQNTVDVSEEKPSTYALGQNYPNPFNPSTTITYEVPEESFVALTVFNDIGQQVGELFRGSRSRGKYTAQFDGSRLSSGVYYYTINAGSFSMTKKMVLTK